MSPISDSLWKQVARLNKLCFGKDDDYNKLVNIKPLKLYSILEEDKLVAYGLVAGGSIAKLERYGVHPECRKKGYGKAILEQMFAEHNLVWTYVSSLNPASAHALIHSGFVITSAGGEWITMIGISPKLGLWLKDNAG